DTSAVRLDVRTEPTLFLPTAFTPDGDGVNDVWPGPVEIPDAGFEIQVFARSGERLWSTTDTQAKWDGASLPIGVYPYTMRMRDPCKPTDEVARNGFVTIVR
ncbi:MAG: gliding motility-associated C-terminal domain-containing protein, partial [Flavobacteriales bacterium]|nr:gliding motility-associated C-terminal domain-containing protein [Flavobacteriales bacterium]